MLFLVARKNALFCYGNIACNLLLTKWLLFPGISLGHVNGKISAVRLGTNDAERVPRRLLRPAAQRTERAACLILRRAGVVLILLPRRSHYPGLNAGVAAPDSSAACSGPAIGATTAPPTPTDPLLNRPARSSRIPRLLPCTGGAAPAHARSTPAARPRRCLVAGEALLLHPLWREAEARWSRQQGRRYEAEGSRILFLPRARQPFPTRCLRIAPSRSDVGPWACSPSPVCLLFLIRGCGTRS